MGKQAGKSGSAVGTSGKADMAGAFSPQANASTQAVLSELSGAMSELGSQHPLSYADHGPHHGMSHHVRHKRVLDGDEQC